MPTQGIAHKNLTDPQLHELKGVSNADMDMVPFSDGEGHSVWKKISVGLVEKDTTNGGSKAVVELPTVGQLSIQGLGSTANGIMSDAVSFLQANKNFKELAVMVIALTEAYTALKEDHEKLVSQYNQVASSLQANGFINGVVDAQ